MKTILRQERISRNWTLDYVAEKVGVSKQAVHDIEVCRRKPSYNVLVALEDLFGLSHRILFSSGNEEK